MKSDKFQTAIREYFNKYKTHPQYEFWIRDHLWKVSIPDSRLLDYIQSVVKFIHKTYIPTLKKEECKILDIGCGMGEFAVFLSLLGYDVVGVDMDQKQLKIAKTLKRENEAKVQFINCDATKLPFRDKEFDIIISFDVFEHVKDLQPIFNEMRRVLKDNGVVFLRFPNKLKGFEDHVGLPLLPLFPERIFQMIFKKITKNRKYYQEGLYVYYRRFSEVYNVLRECNFYISVLPINLVYPPLPRLYEKLSSKTLHPIIQPYFHLLLTKKPVNSSLQDLNMKMKLFEFMWWIFLLIISIAGVFKNIISKKIRRE